MKKSIIDNSEYCFICKRWHDINIQANHIHHCLHGSNRKKADADGLTVPLCYRCHTLLHDKGYHDKDLQQIAEQAYLDHYNASIEDFIQRYGKNYL